MSITNLWIYCKPRLYADLFELLFSINQQVNVVILGDNGIHKKPQSNLENSANVMLLALDSNGNPIINDEALDLPVTKIVAFSTCENLGKRWRPGKDSWEELRPFGWPELVREITDE